MIATSLTHAVGNHARCPDCGNGTYQPAGPKSAAMLVHAASCPWRPVGDRWVACDNAACRRVLDPERVALGAKTCDAKCRAAAWKLKTGYGRHDTVPTAPERRAGRANAQAKRVKPSGAQVSYHRAVALTAEWLRAHDVVDPPEKAELVAALLLRDALSEKQRARLDAREHLR